MWRRKKVVTPSPPTSDRTVEELSHDALEEQVRSLLYRLEAEELVIRIARNHPGYGEAFIQEKKP